MVTINLPTAGVDYHAPFGGRKGSSYGPREQGRYAVEFYTAVKTTYQLACDRARSHGFEPIALAHLASRAR